MSGIQLSKGKAQRLQACANERGLTAPSRSWRGPGGLSPTAQRASRLWPGHPEGFMDAFANIYTDIADAVLARRDGMPADPLASTFPTVADGVLGVAFVDAAVASNAQDGCWTDATLAV